MVTFDGIKYAAARWAITYGGRKMYASSEEERDRLVEKWGAEKERTDARRRRQNGKPTGEVSYAPVEPTAAELGQVAELNAGRRRELYERETDGLFIRGVRKLFEGGQLEASPEVAEALARVEEIKGSVS